MVAKAWAQLGAALTFVPRLGPTSGFFSFFSLQTERSAHEGWKHVSSGGGIAEPCTPLAEGCRATARAAAESPSRRCRPPCIAVHALPCRHAIAQPSSSRDMAMLAKIMHLDPGGAAHSFSPSSARTATMGRRAATRPAGQHHLDSAWACRYLPVLLRGLPRLLRAEAALTVMQLAKIARVCGRHAVERCNTAH